MKIISWNVNSIRKRINQLELLIKKHEPDVILIQEAKCPEDAFPGFEFQAMGYNFLHNLQKAYNGVVVFSKHDMKLINLNLPNFEDEAKRYIEVEINGIKLASIYAPNGNPVFEDDNKTHHQKFVYKLAWLEKFYQYCKEIAQNHNAMYLLAGDFNVIPLDIDAHNIKNFAGDAIAQPEARKLYFKILNNGFVDILPFFQKPENSYTWWSYRGNGIVSNHGVRIDHFLATPKLADSMHNAYVDRDTRMLESPSDHAPIICEVNI